MHKMYRERLCSLTLEMYREIHYYITIARATELNKMKGDKQKMSGKEVVHAIEWLREHDHTDTEIIDFILFVESGRSEKSENKEDEQ